MQAPCYLFYQPEHDTLAHALSEHFDDTVILTPVQGEKSLLEKLQTLPAQADIWTLLDDRLFKVLWQACQHQPVTLYPLPHDTNPHTRAGLLLKDSAAAQLENWRHQPPPFRKQAVCANEKWVLSQVIVGQPPLLKRTGFWQQFKQFFKTLPKLQLHPYLVHTVKQQFKTAALYMRCGESAAIMQRTPSFWETGLPQTGQIAATIYAPLSIMNFVQLFLRRRTNKPLPPGIGTVRANRLSIKNEQPFHYLLDEEKFSHNALELESIPTECRVALGREVMPVSDDKELVRIHTLPTDEESIQFYTQRPLPLFTHANESAFVELFTQIRQNALLTQPFVVLLTLSVLIAAFGLYLNSGPVIIGAMILAPLMAPIVSLAMGVVRLDSKLIVQSARTIGVGTALALFLGLTFAWLLPLGHLTEQMSSRTHPNLLDLGVAILSGLAAAYVADRRELSQSLAGVAIAVALVPPLTVAGIGLGWGNWAMFSGAFLLFLANLAGIVFAAGVLFYVLGYSSLRYMKTALVYKLLMLAVIALPLTLSTHTLWQEDQLYQSLAKLDSIPFQQQRLPVTFDRIEIKNGQKRVYLTLQVPTHHQTEAVETAAAYLKQHLGTDIQLIITPQLLY